MPQSPVRRKWFHTLGPSELLSSSLSMLVVAALASAVYWSALGFGFFNDDPTGHFAWMEGLRPLEPFTTSAGLGFYRPLGFAAWKLLLALFGGYSPAGFHALPIALHAANAALLWILAFYATGRRPYAWAAALSFATFPLSYEAVAYVAATFHPLVVFWALVAVFLYHHARRTGSSSYYAGAYVALLCGLFSHENGVVIPFLLAGWEFLMQRERGLPELARQPLRWFFVAPVLFGLVWLSIPKNSGHGLQTAGNGLRNALPFLQAYVYPLLPALRLKAANPWLLVGIALAAFAALYAVAHIARCRRLYWFAMGWFVLSSLPSIAILKPAYVYGSPRLFYLTSAGAGLLWGLPLLALARLTTGGTWRRLSLRGLQMLVALSILLPPIRFIRCELHFFEQTSQLVRQMAALASPVPPEREVVFVNVPFYFSSCPRYPSGCAKPYPIAPIGAVVIPPYAHVRDFLRVNGGPDRPAHTVTFPGYAPGWTTHGTAIDGPALREYVQSTQVYVFDLARWSWFDLSSAWQLDGPPATDRQAGFGDVLNLGSTGVTVLPDRVEVALRWRVLKTPAQPLTAFVHLYNASGALVAQHDGPPAQGYIPTSLWQPGDRIHDVHSVSPTGPLPSGTYTVAVGLYDPNTVTRLPARAANGGALPDDVYVVGQIDL